MRDTSSPEDRLLRLIKGKYDKRSSARQSKDIDEKSFLLGVTKNFFMQNKLLRAIFRAPTTVSLIVILLLIFGYFIASLVTAPRKDIESIIKSDNGTSNALVGGLKGLPGSAAIPDYSAYINQIKERGLFSGYATPEGAEVAATDMDTDITKKLALVGIIAGESPQAIIEDKEMQKTYYLQKGQSISGAVVEAIGDGKVILNYKGRQVTLVL